MAQKQGKQGGDAWERLEVQVAALLDIVVASEMTWKVFA
jgi:hypothetical protein